MGIVKLGQTLDNMVKLDSHKLYKNYQNNSKP